MHRGARILRAEGKKTVRAPMNCRAGKNPPLSSNRGTPAEIAGKQKAPLARAKRGPSPNRFAFPKVGSAIRFRCLQLVAELEALLLIPGARVREAVGADGHGHLRLVLAGDQRLQLAVKVQHA